MTWRMCDPTNHYMLGSAYICCGFSCFCWSKTVFLFTFSWQSITQTTPYLQWQPVSNPVKCIAVCIVTWFTQSQTKFHSFAILRTQCSSAHDSRSLKRKHWDRESASDSVCSCWLCSCLRRRTVTPCLWKGQCLQEVFVVDEFHK